ncbi:MAG: hypothetical protein K2W96_03925 [Gemmataceae bacterium]|nr:hypothetical protein [Gemmataceae bacterium]
MTHDRFLDVIAPHRGPCLAVGDAAPPELLELTVESLGVPPDEYAFALFSATPGDDAPADLWLGLRGLYLYGTDEKGKARAGFVEWAALPALPLGTDGRLGPWRIDLPDPAASENLRSLLRGLAPLFSDGWLPEMPEDEAARRAEHRRLSLIVEAVVRRLEAIDADRQQAPLGPASFLLLALASSLLLSCGGSAFLPGLTIGTWTGFWVRVGLFVAALAAVNASSALCDRRQARLDAVANAEALARLRELRASVEEPLRRLEELEGGPWPLYLPHESTEHRRRILSAWSPESTAKHAGCSVFLVGVPVAAALLLLARLLG